MPENISHSKNFKYASFIKINLYEYVEIVYFVLDTFIYLI